MMRPLRTMLAAALLAVLLAPTAARATGYAIYEEGAAALGMAGAQTASVHDASALFFNPAALTKLEGTQVYFGGSVLQPVTSMAGTGPNPGWGYTDEMVRQSFYPPTLYATHRFGNWAAGVGVHSPFGLGVEWDPNTFAGRYLVTKVELQTLNATGCLAWAPTDWLSIAGGADMMWAKVQLANRMRPITSPGGGGSAPDIASVALESDFTPAPGWNAALLFTPDPQLRIGAYYRSKVVVKVDDARADFTQLPTGDPVVDAQVAAALPPDQGVSTVLRFPAMWSTGVAFRPDPIWTAELDVVVYQWSVFTDLPIFFHDSPQRNLTRVEDYGDSWQLRMGLERSKGALAVRAGYYFDKSPAPAAAVSPLLPDADRHGVSLGLGFTLGERWNLDVYELGLFVNRRNGYAASAGEEAANYFRGDYKTFVNMVGIGLGYRW